jgi:hypothetical protein
MADKKRADKTENEGHAILGDITPERPSGPRVEREHGDSTNEDDDLESPMHGGSRHGRSEHSGSRDVTEGVTGGTGTETGGTRNYRQGTGATGGDIGNRPE